MNDELEQQPASPPAPDVPADAPADAPVSDAPAPEAHAAEPASELGHENGAPANDAHENAATDAPAAPVEPDAHAETTAPVIEAPVFETTATPALEPAKEETPATVVPVFELPAELQDEPLLRLFSTRKVHESLHPMASQYGDLALKIVANLPPSAERTAALHKLHFSRELVLKVLTEMWHVSVE